MTVKKVSGHIVGAQLTSAEQKALDIELRKQLNDQIIEYDRKYWCDVDRAILYTLHKHYGFGVKRLREFWELIQQTHDDLVKKYEMPGEFNWLVDTKLKEIGVDVDAWNSESLCNNGK